MFLNLSSEIQIINREVAKEDLQSSIPESWNGALFTV